MHYIGQWLLDKWLLKKQLDVRIKGTSATLFYNGRYENQCGHVLLDAVPLSTEASVRVKVGFEQMNANIRVCYLIPKTTNETPRIISASQACPIMQAYGERVV